MRQAILFGNKLPYAAFLFRSAAQANTSVIRSRGNMPFNLKARSRAASGTTNGNLGDVELAILDFDTVEIAARYPVGNEISNRDKNKN